MKQYKPLLILNLCFIYFLSSCSNTSSNNTPLNASLLKENIFVVAKEINKKCPMPIDENTQMDSATVFNEYMITYH
jgi:hypothetical protein